MTDEQKAAFIMAQAAVLNATVAGMVAENYEQMQRDGSLVYGEQDFQNRINASACHHNAVVTFFGS